jgi:polyketide synthase 12
MDPVVDRFTAALDAVDWHEPTLPLYANLTGAPADQEIATPGYWAAQLRGSVRFGAAAEALLAAHRLFVEVGPGGGLSTLVQRTADTTGADPVAVTTLHRDRVAVPEAAAHLFAHGVPVDLGPLLPADDRTTPLPTYPFQH